MTEPDRPRHDAAAPHDTAAKRMPGRRVLVVTGMSGAGRSTALKALEDFGYEAVDNLPLSLLPALLAGADQPTAIGLDVRTRDFSATALLAALRPLEGEARLDLRVIFLDCDDELLGRRYTETRRRHPLAGDRPVMDGIQLERQRLSSLREAADLVIDSSALTAADLRRILKGHFEFETARGISIFVTSFSYRQGLPREADLVFDVRFLENPHYVPSLRPLTGLDPAVGAYIQADPDFPSFFDRLQQLVLPLLPRYEVEGKTYLTIAVGCTGGRHRSVHVAERLGARLREQGIRVTIAHRDIDRAVPPPPAAATSEAPRAGRGDAPAATAKDPV